MTAPSPTTIVVPSPAPSGTAVQPASSCPARESPSVTRSATVPPTANRPETFPPTARPEVGTVGSLNRSPFIVKLEIASGSVPARLGVDIAVRATDPDNDPLGYQWYVDSGPRADISEFFGSGPHVVFQSPVVPSDLGQYSIGVVVSDGRGGTASASGEVSVVIPPGLYLAGPDFSKMWTSDRSVQDSLGFATAAERVKPGRPANSPAAEEAFRNGYMFWYKEDYDGVARIYVLYSSDQTWDAFVDTWQTGVDPDFECTSPPTPPRRGFGKVWCSRPSVADKVGIASAPEVGVGQVSQRFENGMMLRSLDYAVNYILFVNGTWKKEN